MSTVPARTAYYVPSGRITVGGIVLTTVLGGAAGLLLGAAYGYLIQYNPFIYFNVLATLGFGFGLGIAATLGVGGGKLRSPAMATLLGLFVGAVGLYVSWGAWLTALSGRMGDFTIVWDPVRIPLLIASIGAEGAWSISDFTPKGVVLYGLWAIEALIIVGLAALGARSAAQAPFCERCEVWTKSEWDDRRIGRCDDAAALKSQLEAGQFESLGHLPTDDADRYCEIDLSSCPHCQQLGFLDVKSVTVARDAKGKEDKTETELLKHLALDANAMSTLRSMLDAAAAAAAPVPDPGQPS